jgi:hypothetical protein
LQSPLKAISDTPARDLPDIVRKLINPKGNAFNVSPGTDFLK